MVDDDPQTLRYVRDTLTEAGYNPIVTAEPEEALVLMEEVRPQPGPAGLNAAGSLTG